MKQAILFFLYLFSVQLLFSQTPHDVILLLNIGQSNVVGRAQDDLANEVPPTPGTWWYKQSTNSLESLIESVGEGLSQATAYSMNPMLGKRLKELTGHDVIIVPAGVGNTFIVSWLKSSNYYYTRAKQMWQAALAYCASQNITVSAKYVHWLQGENDAGFTETDGYYVMLNQLASDLVSDMGVEKVFATRIGYDPNYTAATNSEKIMKAEKILNFNNPNFIMDSYSPPTYTFANGKMLSDQTHHSLLGLNQDAQDIATAINYYRNTGQKIQLAENVAALQNVTSGYINLTPNWSFDFNNNINEAAGNVLLNMQTRSGTPIPDPSYTSDGAIIISPNTGLLTSRPFSSDTFTIEIRLKMNVNEAWTTVLGTGVGDHYNKLTLHHNNSTSALYVELGTANAYYSWDLGNTVNMSNYHTFKFTQTNGILKFYLDGVQRGDEKNSTESFTMTVIGMGGGTGGPDMDGAIDFFRIKNTVDNSPLPVKFKSFKATNIK
ncbi:LamG-like jellyroll fold domain-containing protein [Flavisolibacter ginsenosidimutans]|uniref:Sialate O-acetylesterase domain-containing protein n=1 Tax=Flavisolibacter ginsenosidimutans TaxID=661481 RepID=A0A5B8UM40_9BACT|nr:LamG-like jellyroll fold domain-containing protein [Flavisolibacter ginsenosidimutans]QEC57628.1 hypothetical protein FSB75_17535 [Flavisolibacter ginsenosidimutans]